MFCRQGEAGGEGAPVSAGIKWLPFTMAAAKLDAKLVEGLMYDLSEEQQACVTAEGPLFLQGRGGSGKTDVLFRRMIQQVSQIAPTLDRPTRVLFTALSHRLVEDVERKWTEQLSVYKLSDPDLYSSLSKTDVCFLPTEPLKSNAHLCLTFPDPIVRREVLGVIAGGIEAVKNGRVLTKSEYVGNLGRTVGGIELQEDERRRVYSQFEKSGLTFDFSATSASYDIIIVDEVRNVTSCLEWNKNLANSRRCKI
jgi:hypothetical protein